MCALSYLFFLLWWMYLNQHKFNFSFSKKEKKNTMNQQKQPANDTVWILKSQAIRFRIGSTHYLLQVGHQFNTMHCISLSLIDTDRENNATKLCPNATKLIASTWQHHKGTAKISWLKLLPVRHDKFPQSYPNNFYVFPNVLTCLGIITTNYT
jgi:hypothetical protein